MSWIRPALLGLSSVALAGCGGIAESRPESSSPSSLEVTLTDFELEPARATVAAGKFTVQVSNRGDSVHALAIRAPDGKQSTEAIEPGAAATLEAELRPGRYAWYCPIGDHRSRGMEGEVTVRGADGGAAAPDDAKESAPASGGY